MRRNIIRPDVGDAKTPLRCQRASHGASGVVDDGTKQIPVGVVGLAVLRDLIVDLGRVLPVCNSSLVAALCGVFCGGFFRDVSLLDLADAGKLRSVLLPLGTSPPMQSFSEAPSHAAGDVLPSECAVPVKKPDASQLRWRI